MSTHTPHREQCRDCKCPPDDHSLYYNHDSIAEYCKCWCHQYCDCDPCMEAIKAKKEPVPIYQDENFNSTEVKNPYAEITAPNRDHLADRLYENLKRINNRLHICGTFTIHKDGKKIGECTNIVITDKKQINDLLKVAGSNAVNLSVPPEDLKICPLFGIGNNCRCSKEYIDYVMRDN